MLKKILLSFASLFLIWQTKDLLQNIEYLPTKSLGLTFLFAWVINMFITGVFAFSGFAFPTQKLLPKTYYQIYNPRRLKIAYAVLRVDWFRQLLLATLWRSKKQRKKYFDGTKVGIDNLIEQSMKSEFGHLLPFLLICILSAYLFAVDSIRLGLFTLVINLIGNLYPIILQRHHRMRIQNTRQKLQ